MAIKLPSANYLVLHHLAHLSWFQVSSIPFDAVMLEACLIGGGANRVLKGPKAAKLLKMVRMIRLMRMSRMSSIVQKIRDILSLNPGVVRLATFLMCVVIFAHYNACIFYYIGEYSLDFTSGAEHDIYSWTTRVSMEVGNNTEMTVHEMPAEVCICKRNTVSTPLRKIFICMQNMYRNIHLENSLAPTWALLAVCPKCLQNAW